MRVKHLFGPALALLVLLGARAGLASELWLDWGECLAGGGASQQVSNCTNTLGSLALVPSFALAAPVDSVVAMEIVVDVISAAAALPDWWRFDPGGCNASALTASADYSALGACADPWSGSGIALAQVWWVGQPRGGANQARLVVSSATLASQTVTLLAGETYYAALIRISLQNLGGASPCLGCLDGACLVLNSIQLIRLPGANPESVTLVPSGGGTSWWATWQNQQASCAAVPVRNRTWGALKSLYR